VWLPAQGSNVILESSSSALWLCLIQIYLYIQYCRRSRWLDSPSIGGVIMSHWSGMRGQEWDIETSFRLRIIRYSLRFSNFFVFSLFFPYRRLRWLDSPLKSSILTPFSPLFLILFLVIAGGYDDWRGPSNRRFCPPFFHFFYSFFGYCRRLRWLEGALTRRRCPSLPGIKLLVYGALSY
jgi:hypothetical protein